LPDFMPTEQRQLGENRKYNRVLIMVADGARDDLTKRLLE